MMKSSSKENDLSRANLVELHDNFLSVNTTSDVFFSHYNNPSEKKYWYGKIKEGLIEDVSPNDWLWVTPIDQSYF